MEGQKKKIEQRLENMKKFYVKAGEIIDNLTDAIPNDIRKKLKILF